MLQSAMLVTSDGKRVLPEDDEFFVTLRDLAPRYDPIEFAVRDLGFVKFRPIDRVMTLIELCPLSVDRRALLAAERRIGKFSMSLFRIHYLDGNGVPENAVPPGVAIAQLRALRTPSASPVTSERFRAEPLDYAKLLRNRDHPLSMLSRKWSEASGAFEPNLMSFADDIGLLSQLMVIRLKPRSQITKFHFIGDGHQWLNRHYPKKPVGEDVENLPDREYGAWVSSFYRSVAGSAEPRYDEVTAVLRLDAKASSAVRYERLLLPWKTPSNETLITMVSNVVWREHELAASTA